MLKQPDHELPALAATMNAATISGLGAADTDPQ